MTRFLFISSYSGLGGGETATLNLAAALGDSECHLLVPSVGDFSRAWENQGGIVHVVKWRGASVYFVPFIWAQLPIRHTIQRIIHEQQIDVIHCDYHTLPMALPAAKQLGIPLIWMCMGWWFHPRRWQVRFFKQIDVIFAHSEAIRDGFLGDPPVLLPEKVETLYPGVDVQRFSPHVDGAIIRDELNLGDCPVVVMVARFQSVKGHDIFIRMAHQVLRRIPNAQFVVAGENTQTTRDNQYKSRILRMVEQSRTLRRHIHYIGHRDDVEHVLAAADVVVCASDFEGFGMVNVEAMASGKAVVSTNNGGPAETVIDGVTGYLVTPRDDTALAQRVIELLYSENTRRRMGAAGRLRVQQVFSIDSVVERFQEHVDALVNQSFRHP